MRPHQWVKNLLVFAPLLAHHEYSLSSYMAALGLFAALSVCASGSYFFNDMLDLASDRGHPTKSRRPLASGEISIPAAAAAGFSLAFAGIALGFGVSTEAGYFMLLYLSGSLAYSLLLKRILFLDVTALAGLFALRVLIGSTVSAPLSHWFLAFAIFLFLSLAVVKRQAELSVQEKSESMGDSASIYYRGDRSALTSIGAASGVAAVVAFTLYLHSPEVSARYGRADLLWLLCPPLIYWIGRMTLLANRGEVGSDPVTFALRDKASWIAFLACSAVFWAAL